MMPKIFTVLFRNSKPIYICILIALCITSCKEDLGSTTYETPLKDIDGNTYATVKIGDQVWMASNLRTRSFSNGDSILFVGDTIILKDIIDIDSTDVDSVIISYKIMRWDSLNSDTVAKSACCYYGNKRTSHVMDTLGALYNWYAVNDDRGLCPRGYHIPSKAEWETMVKFLGGKDVAGGRLKSNDSSFWIKPVMGLNNVLGFNALPGGACYPDGNFDDKIGLYGFFWTKTAYESRDAWIFYVYSNHEGAITKYSRKGHGYSVRCIKD